MHGDSFIFSIFAVFTGAAVLAGLALYARQPLLIAYIALGVLLGPWGLRWITDPGTVSHIGEVGIVFLLFLLGLNLHPQKLVILARQATVVTVVSSAIFVVAGAAVAAAFGFGLTESLLVGAATMFSSTIVCLKLMPTTALHHRHTGELVISVLLMQDILAILMLLVIQGGGGADASWVDVLLAVAALPLLVAGAFVLERWVVLPLMRRFDTIQEYVFLAAIGWCVGVAQAAEWLGLSYEIGAFVAGVALASNIVSRFIAESLKPLRDFFLILFFFSLGAGFELPVLPQVALPAAVLALVVLAVKPVVFRWLFKATGETPGVALEIGVRLGQASEFSLLIAFLAAETAIVGERAGYLIQAATLLTFIVSSYLVTLYFPTPIAASAKLRRD